MIGGEATETYTFETGFYGLTTMPPEIHKIMDKILQLRYICRKSGFYHQV